MPGTRVQYEEGRGSTSEDSLGGKADKQVPYSASRQYCQERWWAGGAQRGNEGQVAKVLACHIP